ncbi:hypothetical protein ERO13_A13G095900v2 [Gossypium hirsutum]|uniref:Uncharacterized protein isoform X1 n=1 Tax=Gossypium hirsutum TaxID=3635 RepID=A0A1U8IBG1_GOSHI|nr:uncharacterized protein LOC107894888 isoform X1 [Gossypium hirsutum]KAG4165878.1 hypothetical protein ERO13_A13G095900v2 [Gossypium hirsutum]
MISMENKGFNVILMVLFLGLCCLLISCATVPAISKGNLNSDKELLLSSARNLLAQDVKKSSEAEEMFEEYLGHKFNEERMLIETTDYPPPGPDPKHDPHAPPPPQS